MALLRLYMSRLVNGAIQSWKWQLAALYHPVSSSAPKAIGLEIA